MKSLKINFIVLAMLIFMAITSTTILSAELSEYDDEDVNNEISDNLPSIENQEPITSLGATSRFLAQKYYRPAVMTCDKYPRVCRVKGSPGPDCCKKKCVNVSTDKLNCGKCGKKCKYSESCCKGKCVNTMFDKKHCGSCNKKCKKGSSCVYGMCSYA